MIETLRKLSSNQFFKNYVKVFSVDVLVKGAGIILLPVYLRLMTQEEYGLYGYLIAIISTFSLVFNLGIYTAQSKLYHEYDGVKQRSALYTINAVLLAFIALLVFLILIFDIDYPVIHFLFKNPIDYKTYRFPILVGVLVSVYSVMLVNYFLTSENIRKLQFFNVARIILINGIVIAILYVNTIGDHALARIKYSFFIEFMIVAVFSVFYIRSMTFRFDKVIAIKAVKISIPVLVSAILGLFINLSDRYFIEKFGSLRDLSVYNLALTIASIIPFVFASFQNIWLPQFLKEKDYRSNRAKSKKMTVRLIIIFSVLSIAIFGLLKVMLLINIISDRYEDILPLLPVVMMTTILASMTTMYSNHLIYLDKLYLIVIVGVPIAIVGIFLNLILVPRYNVYGAAFSSFITNACYLIAYLIIVNYFYKEKSKPVPYAD